MNQYFDKKPHLNKNDIDKNMLNVIDVIRGKLFYNEEIDVGNRYITTFIAAENYILLVTVTYCSRFLNIKGLQKFVYNIIVFHYTNKFKEKTFLNNFVVT